MQKHILGLKLTANELAVYTTLLMLTRSYEQMFEGFNLLPGKCVITQVRLAERLGITRDEVRKVIRQLVDKKLIFADRVPDKGYTIYTVREILADFLIEDWERQKQELGFEF